MTYFSNLRTFNILFLFSRDGLLRLLLNVPGVKIAVHLTKRKAQNGLQEEDGAVA